MELVYLVRDRLIQTKGYFFQILRKFKGDDVFLGCVREVSRTDGHQQRHVLYVSRPCVLNACLAKKKTTYQIHKSRKRCFNLNHEAIYCPQSAFHDRTEEGISVVMFAFLSIFSRGFLLLFIAQ